MTEPQQGIGSGVSHTQKEKEVGYGWRLRKWGCEESSCRNQARGGPGTTEKSWRKQTAATVLQE